MAQTNANPEEPSLNYTDVSEEHEYFSNSFSNLIPQSSNSFNLGSQNQLLDISYSTNEPIENQNIQDIRKLLSDWDQEFLAEHFIAQKVFVDVLKVIKPHHIERLLKEFEMGTQIMFEHKLEEWRQSIGMPLVRYNNILGTQLSQSSAPTSPCSSRASTPPFEQLRFAPYSIPKNMPNTSSDCDISLSDILNETPKGVMLVEYYKKFAKFQEEQRTSLINLIAKFFDDKGVSISLATSYRLEREILDRFSTEKLEYYRSSKRGKIYNKFCNLKTLFKTAVTKHVSEPRTKALSKKSRIQTSFEPEDDAESCLRALKFDNLTAEQFDNTWKACSQYRLNDIKVLGNTAAIIEKWHFYKSPTGFRLIDMDFNVAFDHSDGLLTNWEKCCSKIFEFLCNENHIKDKNIRGLLEHLKTNENISEHSRTASLLWALHGYFVPTNKTVITDAHNGKKKTTKFTIKDSQESFLFVGKNIQEIEDHINHLRLRGGNIQPFIYCIGSNVFSIEEMYIFFDNIRFKFFNFLRTVDICFKIFNVFDLDFPAESCMFYTFIETYFYKMRSQQKYSKVSILIDYLNVAE